MEIWKDIEGYENKYQISNIGNVKSLARNAMWDTGSFSMPERLMKLQKHNRGYRFVMLTKDKTTKLFLIHRLVAKAFISNPNNLKTVNHIDFDKTNNKVENLEWMSHLDNIKHFVKLGTKQKQIGSNGPMAKFTDSDIIKIREMVKTIKQADIARIYNIGTDVISRIIKRQTYYNI
jgi:hypothetical protein